MPTIDWPEALIPQTAQLALRKAGTQFASPFNGTLQALDFIAERWVLSASLAQMAMRNPRGVDAFCNTLAGGVERVRVWPFHTGGVPRGSLRGAPTLSATVNRGAQTLPLANVRAGANLLTPAQTGQTFLLPTVLTNATAATGVADPSGGTSAYALTRTAIGNHFAYMQAASAAGARTVSGYVWLRAGTLTGSVTLRLRDGADVEHSASVSVTPTAAWAVYRISAAFPSGAAANTRFYIDPSNDTGSAGDTLQVWFSEVEVAAAVDEACVSWREAVAAPAEFGGVMGAWRVIRTAAGNAFTTWFVPYVQPGGRTFTYSVWLRADTYVQPITLFLRDGAANTYGTTSCTITSQWQRFSVTGVFPGGAANNILCVVDPGDLGSVGERYERFGDQLEVGGSPSTHAPMATVEAGDYVASGGQLFQAAAGAAATRYGTMDLPVLNRVRGTIAINSPVTWYRPSCEMVLPAMQAGPVRRPGVIESTALDLVEVW